MLFYEPIDMPWMERSWNDPLVPWSAVHTAELVQKFSFRIGPPVPSHWSRGTQLHKYRQAVEEQQHSNEIRPIENGSYQEEHRPSYDRR